MANVSVIGAGSWGTALALLLCKNGHDVTVWSYKEEEVRTLSEKREHVSKLPGVKIPNEIFFTADLKEAVEGKDVVVLAVPSIHVSKRNRRRHPDDTVPADRRGDTAGRCSGSFGTKSCRRSRKRSSYNGLYRSTYRGDCKVFTAAFYE